MGWAETSNHRKRAAVGYWRNCVREAYHVLRCSFITCFSGMLLVVNVFSMFICLSYADNTLFIASFLSAASLKVFFVCRFKVSFNAGRSHYNSIQTENTDAAVFLRNKSIIIECSRI